MFFIGMYATLVFDPLTAPCWTRADYTLIWGAYIRTKTVRTYAPPADHKSGPPPCLLRSYGRQAEGYGPQGGWSALPDVLRF